MRPKRLAPFSDSHSTFIRAALQIREAVRTLPIKRVLGGHISGDGGREIKVRLLDAQGAVLLKVYDQGACQEMFVYCDDPRAMKVEIARKCRNLDLPIRFR